MQAIQNSIIIQYAITHWFDILTITLFLATMLWLFRSGRKETFYKIIYSLVAKAEEAFGAKTGPLKKARVYAKLPWTVRLLFTQAQIEAMIELAVDELQEFLEEKEDEAKVSQGSSKEKQKPE